MGTDIASWRRGIGCASSLLNTIGRRKEKILSTLHSIKMTEYRRKTRGAYFWISAMLVSTLLLTSIITINAGNGEFIIYDYVVNKLKNSLIVMHMCILHSRLILTLIRFSGVFKDHVLLLRSGDTELLLKSITESHF